MTQEKTAEPTKVIPAVRSDSVCQYLGGLAGILSSMVVDINAQMVAIQTLPQTTTPPVQTDTPTLKLTGDCDHGS